VFGYGSTATLVTAEDRVEPTAPARHLPEDVDGGAFSNPLVVRTTPGGGAILQAAAPPPITLASGDVTFEPPTADSTLEYATFPVNDVRWSLPPGTPVMLRTGTTTALVDTRNVAVGYVVPGTGTDLRVFLPGGAFVLNAVVQVFPRPAAPLNVYHTPALQGAAWPDRVRVDSAGALQVNAAPVPFVYVRVQVSSRDMGLLMVGREQYLATLVLNERRDAYTLWGGDGVAVAPMPQHTASLAAVRVTLWNPNHTAYAGGDTGSVTALLWREA
jgi:hypothetical protein